MNNLIIFFTTSAHKVMLFMMAVAYLVALPSTYSQDHFVKVITPADAYYTRGMLQVAIQNDSLVFLESGYYQGESSRYFRTFLSWYSTKGDRLHRVDLGGSDNLGKILVDGDQVVVLGNFSRVQDSLDLIKVREGRIDQRLRIYDPYQDKGQNRISCLIKHGNHYVVTSTLERRIWSSDLDLPHVTTIFDDLSTVDTTFSLPLEYCAIYETATVHDSTIVMFFQRSNYPRTSGIPPADYEEYQGFYTIDRKGAVLDSFAYLPEDYVEDSYGEFPISYATQLGKITPEGLRVTIGPASYWGDYAFVFDANNNLLAKYSLPLAPYRQNFVAFDVLPDSTIVMLSTWNELWNIYAGDNQGINGMLFQRMDLKGNILVEKKYGIVDPDYISTVEINAINYLDGNRLVLLGAAQRPGPSPLDSSVSRRIDNILWVVDSLGCYDVDRCNDGALAEPHDVLYAYDQLTMRHKTWEVVVDGDTISYAFGRDTLTGYDGAGPYVARPLQVSQGDGSAMEMHEDSLFYFWARTGKVWLSPYDVGSFNEYDTLEMIYDFTLTDGDIFSLPFGLGDAEVVATDTVMLLDEYPRKRIILRHTDPVAHQQRGLLTWIDGIGATSRMDYYNDWIEHSESSVIRYYDRDRLRYEAAPPVEYTDMLPSATWYSQTLSLTPGGDLELNITKVVGDTILDNRYGYILGVTNGGVYYPESELPVFVKDGQFFYYEDDAWHLLFDVSAEVGDIVHYTLSSKMPYYVSAYTPNNYIDSTCYRDSFVYVVEQVDTIYDELGNAYRALEVGNGGCTWSHELGTIIEHVGPMNRLMGRVSPLLTMGNIFPLMRCYQDELTYFNFTHDGADCMILTSTSETPEAKVSIYPNPVEDVLFVKGLPDQEVEFKISTLYGQEVRAGHLVREYLDVADLPVGVYILQLQDGSALKFVKL